MSQLQERHQMGRLSGAHKTVQEAQAAKESGVQCLQEFVHKESQSEQTCQEVSSCFRY